ncbi:hypothetical protein [Mesorhizobium sp.]|uniref:hypothetical protein n=1 Tax=Mesorhizobium sp. TaxID=1871066 RepID=UPI000FE65477|nr:hypothetical protein [Mesorhizobium sp.]RWA97496.1 MAG: hypothetical protein EOQ33_31425 [Mesorhizobium sp.]
MKTLASGSLLVAFPDAYAIEITGGLSEIAVSHERLVEVSEEIENLAAEAAVYGDEFWWQLSLDERFRPANHDIPPWLTGKKAFRLAS